MMELTFSSPKCLPSADAELVIAVSDGSLAFPFVVVVVPVPVPVLMLALGLAGLLGFPPSHFVRSIPRG
jgi:hypothetical protein